MSADRYRLTLDLWASQHVPPGATVIDVRIYSDPGYKYSSYTFEDPHVDVTVTYEQSDGIIGTRDVEVETLGALLTALFTIEETNP